VSTGDDDALSVLRRWELFGGRWRVLARTGSGVTLGLFSCDGGQEMSRVTAPASEFDAFLDARSGRPPSPGLSRTQSWLSGPSEASYTPAKTS
jgi:hypothetical protein